MRDHEDTITVRLTAALGAPPISLANWPAIWHRLVHLQPARFARLEGDPPRVVVVEAYGSAEVDAHLDPAGTHYLLAGLWHRLSHRADIGPHLRCELLIQLQDGEQVLSLLDVPPAEYNALRSVQTRSDYERMDQLMMMARSVREYEENLRRR